MRLRNYMVTDFTGDINYWKNLENGNHCISYLVGQMEICPSTQRVHFQGYIELDKAVDLRTLKNSILPVTCHLEPRRGTQAQAVAYCTKDDTRCPDHEPFTWGEMKAQGKRNDLNRAIELLQEKVSIIEVINDQPGLLPYINALGKYQSMLHDNVVRDEAPEVIVIVGEPGTGKTREVYDKEPEVYRVAEPTSTVWFDGYRGEEAVLFDDFNGNIRYHYLLQLLDRYKMRVNIKGGTTNWCPKRIYITSNSEPTSWYQQDTKALIRRITKMVYKSTEVAGNTNGHYSELEKMFEKEELLDITKA